MLANRNGLFEDAPPRMHDKVCCILDNEERGKLLDAPCGEGALSLRLGRKGFQVTACDLNNKVFRARGITFQKADLNQKLPFTEDYSNYVICIEEAFKVQCVFPTSFDISKKV